MQVPNRYQYEEKVTAVLADMLQNQQLEIERLLGNGQIPLTQQWHTVGRETALTLSIVLFPLYKVAIERSDPTLNPQQVQDLATLFVGHHATTVADGITGTTRDSVDLILKKAADLQLNGQPTEGLHLLVEKLPVVFRGTRAESIAVTETTRANSIAEVLMYSLFDIPDISDYAGANPFSHESIFGTSRKKELSKLLYKASEQREQDYEDSELDVEAQDVYKVEKELEKTLSRKAAVRGIRSAIETPHGILHWEPEEDLIRKMLNKDDRRVLASRHEWDRIAREDNQIRDLLHKAKQIIRGAIKIEHGPGIRPAVPRPQSEKDLLKVNRVFPPIDRVEKEVRKRQKKLVMIWNTQEDERVCPICGPLDKQPYPKWRRRFPLGPPCHTNCRCFITLI